MDGIKRVRFLTGHPRDLNPEIIQAVAEVPSACEFFHLPIQAGCDRTLRRMARGYKVDFYRGLVDQIRSIIPGAAITTDLIVGFPGETESEFMNTVSLVEELAFDACNTAAYSARQHTPSANWDEQIPDQVKYERLRFLNSIVTEVSSRVNKRYLGSVQEILVEGPSERNPDRLAGRTGTNKVVNFQGTTDLIGQLVNVEIQGANAWALRGELVGSDKADRHTAR